MIPIFEPEFAGKEKEYLLTCIETGWISSQGEFIERFEGAFADFVGMPHGVATSNCTTALHLALAALDIGPGDEVLCPDLTFISPANMIALCGATPVLVDVTPQGWGIDPDRLDAHITPATKALIVVHPFGHAADMDPIMEICDCHGIPVIEDVAEAPGGTYKGRNLGTFGVMACYSFFANKVMTTGEGGIVLTNDAALNERLRVLRDHGMSRQRRYHHIALGYNYRMTNMQAAVGLGQLERLPETLTHRAAQDARYRDRFAGSPHVQFRPALPYCGLIHWLATVTLASADLRDPLLAHLKANGIDGRQMVNPVHEAEHFQRLGGDGFPVATDISHRSLHLPSGSGLAEAEIDMIADTVLQWAEAQAA